MRPLINKLLVKNILENADHFKWTYQGLGMIRLYLSDSVRLHVWDPSQAVPGVTDIHTHPWDFTSYVITGRILDQRLHKNHAEFGAPYLEQKIVCGPGGGMSDEPVPYHLFRASYFNVLEGESYVTTSYDIHKSTPDPGTVTILDRSFKDNRDEAYVYVPQGSQWVSAESRPATESEVVSFTSLALKGLK